MQQVYVAKDLSFDRRVALKVPKNTSAEKRFARSARMSARVNHANVAKTLDYFEENSRSYLVEKLVEGSDLGEILDTRFYSLDPHLAAHLLHHIAKGTAASHHAGVFHRDLKPSNIIVSSDPSLRILKITDFGIAKMAEQEIEEAFKEDTITGSQTVMGALPYMSPEMVSSPKQAGLPSDIWAIGAILYRLLAGNPPFGAGLSAVPRILDASPPTRPQFHGKKPQFELLENELWDVITACLKKDPSERPSADRLVEMCAHLCYSDAPRQTGVIGSFRRGPGAWGSITSATGYSIFFHQDSFYGDKPAAGVAVNFAAFPGFPKARAFPVLPCKA